MCEDINTQFFEPQMFRGAPVWVEKGCSAEQGEDSRTWWLREHIVWRGLHGHAEHAIGVCNVLGRKGVGPVRECRRALIWVERSPVSTFRSIPR